MTDRDAQLQQIIEQNPGIQFREIMRSSGLKNGVLSHHLGKLEKRHHQGNSWPSPIQILFPTNHRGRINCNQSFEKTNSSGFVTCTD